MSIKKFWRSSQETTPAIPSSHQEPHEVVDDAFVLLAGGEITPEIQPKPKPTGAILSNEANLDFIALAGGALDDVPHIATDSDGADPAVPEGEDPGRSLFETAPEFNPGQLLNTAIDVDDPHLATFGPLPDVLEGADGHESDAASHEADAIVPPGSLIALPVPADIAKHQGSGRWFGRKRQKPVIAAYDEDPPFPSEKDERALLLRLRSNQPQRSGGRVVLAMLAILCGLSTVAIASIVAVDAVPEAKQLATRVRKDLIARFSNASAATAKPADNVCAQQPTLDGCFTNNVVRAAAFVCPTAMHPIAVEFASSPVRAAIGLSHRPSMAPSTGFATVLSSETTFDYMTRDLNFAVDLVSFRRNGTIAGMLKNIQPRQQLPVQVAKADGIIALRGNEIERLALTPDCRIAIFENGVPADYFSQEARVSETTPRTRTQAQADIGRR